MLEALRSYLLASATISAITTRMEPAQSKQTNVLPRIVYFVVGTSRDHELRQANGVCEARVQLSLFADTYAEILTLRNAIVQRVNGYSGTTGGVEFDIVTVENDQDQSETATGGKQFGVYHRVIELLVKYRESIPTLT